MNFNESIEYIRGIDVWEYIGDFRWSLDRFLHEGLGIPVILTADLKEVHQAWYSMTYKGKVWDQNPIKELDNCFNTFGGPHGTWLELVWAIKDYRDGEDYKYWMIRNYPQCALRRWC